MNLSSVASALGAGFQGYDQDQQEATRKALVARQQSDQDEDRVNRMIAMGYHPVAPPTNPALSAALGPATGTTPGMTPGGPSAPLDAALTAAATPTAPNVPANVTVTTAAGPQHMAFDYDSSPQGQQERKKRTQELEDQTRQQALAKQKAGEAEALRVAAQTRAYGSIQKYYPTDPSATADFDPNANDYVKSFADLEQTDRETNAEIAKAKAQGVAQQGVIARQADADARKILPNGTDPTTGQPAYVRYDPKTDRMIPIPGSQPTAKAEASAAQMAAAKANLESAIANMNDFEGKLKTGDASYSPEDATLAALASSPTANTASGIQGVSSEVSNRALAKIQQDNPDLYRYITNKKYVAEAILNTHKRPNQTQYDIEQELSGAGPTDDPTTPGYSTQIDMGAQRRQRMYQDVFGGGSVLGSGGMAGGAGNRTAANTPADPAKQAQRAARWNQLVTRGMDKASATAQVTREIP